jgi:glutathione S-transferase
MDLYDNPFSPYAFKVRSVLYEKGSRTRSARSAPTPIARCYCA